jgi:hypothetical protein
MTRGRHGRGLADFGGGSRGSRNYAGKTPSPATAGYEDLPMRDQRGRNMRSTALPVSTDS